MNYLISVVNPGAMERVCEIAAALDLPQTVAMLAEAQNGQVLAVDTPKACWIFLESNPLKSESS